MAKGEKSAKAMAIHKKEVPQSALTRSSRATSEVVGGLITVKILPEVYYKVITTTLLDGIYNA